MDKKQQKQATSGSDQDKKAQSDGKQMPQAGTSKENAKNKNGPGLTEDAKKTILEGLQEAFPGCTANVTDNISPELEDFMEAFLAPPKEGSFVIWGNSSGFCTWKKG